MSETIKGYSYTKCQSATATLNVLLNTVLDNAGINDQTGKRKHRCDILVLGYGDSVTPLLGTVEEPLALPDLPRHSLGRQIMHIARRDPVTRLLSTEEVTGPYWIKEVADSKRTETGKAIAKAYEAVGRWLLADNTRKDTRPAPVIINITDAQDNGSENPVQKAIELRQLSTTDGHALFFNCHLGTTGTDGLTFPATLNQVDDLFELALQHIAPTLPMGTITRSSQPTEDEKQLRLEQICARQLFEMSSPMPDIMLRNARRTFGLQIEAGARGFIYNADAQDLINFLEWGSLQDRFITTASREEVG
ncbi:MAG TPA: hypothetical protein VFU32_03115 [Ktedonobacterales bacterium]|nr:hypothetical protein [Ktedonobacterales bacterium]